MSMALCTLFDRTDKSMENVVSIGYSIMDQNIRKIS